VLARVTVPEDLMNLAIVSNLILLCAVASDLVAWVDVGTH
jgi:hypothetical protein